MDCKIIQKSNDLRITIETNISETWSTEMREDSYQFTIRIQERVKAFLVFSKWKNVKLEFVWVKDKEELIMQIDKIYQEYIENESKCNNHYERKIELLEKI